MLIDLRESSLADIRFLITKKQLRELLKERVYSLFGLDEGLGKKRYPDETYRKALQSTIIFGADTLMDVFESFSDADDATKDIVASFLRFRLCAYFDHSITIPVGNNLVDMFIFSLLHTAESVLIHQVVSKNPPLDTNEYDIFGRHRDRRY